MSEIPFIGQIISVEGIKQITRSSRRAHTWTLRKKEATSLLWLVNYHISYTVTEPSLNELTKFIPAGWPADRSSLSYTLFCPSGTSGKKWKYWMVFCWKGTRFLYQCHSSEIYYSNYMHLTRGLRKQSYKKEQQ